MNQIVIIDFNLHLHLTFKYPNFLKEGKFLDNNFYDFKRPSKLRKQEVHTSWLRAFVSSDKDRRYAETSLYSTKGSIF